MSEVVKVMIKPNVPVNSKLQHTFQATPGDFEVRGYPTNREMYLSGLAHADIYLKDDKCIE